MASVSLRDVVVRYPIYGRSRQRMVARFRGVAGLDRHSELRPRPPYLEALSGITLEIARGDRIAFIGSNGAGKSTLLRVIAGIYEPVSGEVRVTGRIASTFNLRLGMEREATGYENIRLRGLALGLQPREIDRIMPGIAEFTELGEHLDLPVSTYSSGMMARLALAVSTAISPDILVMDEWIGAGDARFRKKARQRLLEMVDRARILVLATHDASLVRRICNKAVWLDRGRIVEQGESNYVLARYEAGASDETSETGDPRPLSPA